MRKHKKGFTIVELVIVIAVIAILAAVLIPTFSALIKKADLSSDMQAVRQMNVALQEDEALHGKPANLDVAMQILANHEINTQNWQCLTEGYQVFWYKTDNRCVLYNTKTGEVEFPEEYDFKDIASNTEEFFLYNQFVESALSKDFSLTSNANKGESLSSELKSAAKTEVAGVLNTSDTVAKSSILKSIGIANPDKIKVNGYQEIKSSETAQTYTSLKVYALAEEELSSSEEIEANFYYLSTVRAESPNPAELKSAEQAAGVAIYDLFTQINNGKISGNVSIVLDSDTVLRLDDRDYKPVKLFTGYFGTPDDEHPVIIDGMKMTALGYSETYTFSGTNSTYYLSGFIGAVYGESTIENITFRNLVIDRPASDYSINVGVGNSNCTALIGGIVLDANGTDANVTLRNIKAESTVKISGNSRVGGIVGYIGGFNYGSSTANLNGTVKIENCEFAGKVESLNNGAAAGTSSYSTCGGIVGYCTRAGDTLSVEIDGCKFTGEAGALRCGGIYGDWTASKQTIASTSLLKITNCTSTGTIIEAPYGNPSGALLCCGKVLGNVRRTAVGNRVIVDTQTITNGNYSTGEKVIGCSEFDFVTSSDAGAAVSLTFTDVPSTTKTTDGCYVK